MYFLYLAAEFNNIINPGKECLFAANWRPLQPCLQPCLQCPSANRRISFAKKLRTLLGDLRIWNLKYPRQKFVRIMTRRCVAIRKTCVMDEPRLHLKRGKRAEIDCGHLRGRWCQESENRFNDGDLQGLPQGGTWPAKQGKKACYRSPAKLKIFFRRWIFLVLGKKKCISWDRNSYFIIKDKKVR